MKSINPVWLAACTISGLLAGQILGHFYGDKVILVCVAVLFVLLADLFFQRQSEESEDNGEDPN